MNEHTPPRFALRFLEWFCPPGLYEGIEGDLLEEYDLDRSERGATTANIRLVFNVLRFFRPGIILRNRFTLKIINTVMLGNYLKVASRNIAKRKLYSFINAFGLSVAIAFCTLIYLFVQDEKSFDQFHEDKERIYRLHTTNFNSEKHAQADPHPFNSHAYLPAKMSEVMLDEMAEVESITRFTDYNSGIMSYGTNNFNQRFACIDSGFFRVFSFKILAGDHKNPLRTSSDVVLTPEVAKKFFGDEDPIGKTISVASNGTKKELRVTALIEPPPANSSIDFSMLVSFEAHPWFAQSREQWGNFSYPTFVKVRPNTNMDLFKVHLDTLTNKYLGERFKKWREREAIPAGIKPTEFDAMPITDIHLAKDISWTKVSDKKYSWILGGIAILILAIACINYISLALTTSASRRVEVGIRKVVGAQKKEVAWQFTIESVVLALISMSIGLVFVVLFLPYFNEFTQKSISITLTNSFFIVTVALTIALVIGFIAGAYPAFFLSGFLPALVLKGRFTSRLQAGFTKPLVVFQFFLSASMIICSVIMYRQMIYVTTKDLGYNQEQVIAIPTQLGWVPEGKDVVEQYRNAVKTNPSVVNVAGTSNAFAHGLSSFGYRIKGENKEAFIYAVDSEYIPLLGIELTQGRNFDPAILSDSAAVIVNEALVKDMKWTDPLNEHLNWKEDSASIGSPVIGVMKDFHFMSLERSIEPMFISQEVGYLMNILVKITPDQVPEKVEQLRKAWVSLYPDKPFEYTFVDEDVAKQYDIYKRWSKIMGLSTIFAILIACLGLFGLAGINAINRTKEIGIRKVMGAPLTSIFLLLNRQFMFFALIAFVLAIPASWYAMNKWLSSFKFAITIGWQLFAVSLLAGLTLALVTVSYHAIKAALINPAETLKHE